MKQSATVYNYYQSYYLAKAWVELGLAELGHRGIGWEQTFADSGFVWENFICSGRCDMEFSLSWTANNLSQQFRTDNTCQSPFLLSGGQSFILPLFRDSGEYGLSQGFATGIGYTNLYGALQKSNIITNGITPVTFGMVVLSGNDLANNGIFFQTGDLREWLWKFLDSFDAYFRNLSNLASLTSPRGIAPYRFFFMISNSSQENISFCLSGEQALPTQQYYLQSQWTYDHQNLVLEAVYKQPIPDFLLNGYLNY